MSQLSPTLLPVCIEKAYAFLLRAVLQTAPPWARLRIARGLYYFDHPLVRGFEATVPYCRRLRFKLHTKEVIGWRIFFCGEYERATNAVVRAICRPGDVVIEAGANNGSETLLVALLVGERGRVHAFEPVPHVHNQLAENVRLNRLENVVSLEQIALGEQEKDVSFYLTPRSVPNQGMSSQFAFPGSSETLKVRQRTLDGWAADRGLQRLDFLKMDIQGGELGLLEGGCTTIARHLPVIVTEAAAIEQGQAGRSLTELWVHLADAGYEIWFFGPSGLTRVRMALLSSETVTEGMWLALPRENRNRLAQIRAQLGLTEPKCKCG